MFIILGLITAGSGQVGTPEVAWSQQFRVRRIFKGHPAAVRLTTARARRFRAVVRDGAKHGPNFAGRYTVIAWGCGASCHRLAIADAVSGKVFDAPFRSVSAAPPYPLPDDVDVDLLPDFGELQYRLDSRLLIVGGCLNEDNARCGWHYFEWKDERLTERTRLPFPDPDDLPKKPAAR